MMKEGTPSCEHATIIALEYGYIHIVKFILSESSRFYKKNYISSCKNRHINIVNLMIVLGATDFNTIMVAASKGDIRIL